MKSPRHGKSYWFDLPAVDIVDARSFYEGLFDWKFLRLSDSVLEDYWVIQAGDELIGGLRKFERIVPVEAMPVVYVTVDNLDAMIQRVKDLGGKLIGSRIDLGKGRGTYQWFKDREGNMLALWGAEGASV